VFEKLLSRLPKNKTQEELDEHFKKMESVELEKGDFTAMVIAAVLTLGIPVLLIAGAIYGLIWFFFVR